MSGARAAHASYAFFAWLRCRASRLSKNRGFRLALWKAAGLHSDPPGGEKHLIVLKVRFLHFGKRDFAKMLHAIV